MNTLPLLALALLLSACGQTGPLKRPEPNKPASSAPAAPEAGPESEPQSPSSP